MRVNNLNTTGLTSSMTTLARARGTDLVVVDDSRKLSVAGSAIMKGANFTAGAKVVFA